MSNVEIQVAGNDHAFLRQRERRIIHDAKKTIRLVDLFCGCGGISLGVQEACFSLGYGIEIPLAVDFEKEASACYAKNFPFANVRTCDVSEMFSASLSSPFTQDEIQLQSEIGSVDILVGGPPCQGHSDLNRYTRRDDPKNKLYLFMARAAEVFKPRHIIIENVVGAMHDKGHVVQIVQDQLLKLGYHVSIGIVDLVKIGVPQTRRRLIMLASKTSKTEVQEIEEKYCIDTTRNVKWAIADLQNPDSQTIVDTPATPSKDNARRIGYLFDHDIYDLPNEERPPCHRNKNHSYNSIYGRLHWEKPAQTITSGFYSSCMGRYVHPAERRTLTAHEAARLQFFPDFFDFAGVSSRTALATIIGNAVPMKLPYAVCRELLRQENGELVNE